MHARRKVGFNWVQFMYRLARCKVPSEKARPHILKHINKFIRAGSLPSSDVIYATLDDKYKCEINVTTLQVWHKSSN